MKYSDKPSRGRKQCQNCNKYVGVCCTVCPNCNTSFDGQVKIVVPKVSAAKVLDEGGKGRKQCPNCQKYTGARSHTCPNCNTEFEGKAVQETPQTEVVADSVTEIKREATDSVGLHGGTILVPAGKCPIPLVDTGLENVRVWANKVREVYQKRGEKIADSGIRYFAQTFYPAHTDEYKAVIEAIS